MIPLCLITGFLGSGKTTLMERLARRRPRRRLVFLVNEFARHDVDGRRLESLAPAGMPVIRMIGGSIFCNCLAGALIENLKTIARDHAQNPVEGLVIEASGIADPTALPRMLRDHRLDEVFDLRSVVNVVDPSQFLKVLKSLPAVRRQVEAAGVSILNHTDRCSEEQVVAAETALRGMRPDATVVRTVRCRFAFDPFEGGLRNFEVADPATEPSPPGPLVSMVYDLHRPVSVALLEQAFRAAGPDLYRAKGVVWINGRTGVEPIEADWVNGRLETRPAVLEVGNDPLPLDSLVVIFHGQSRTSVVSALRMLRNEPASVSVSDDSSPLTLRADEPCHV